MFLATVAVLAAALALEAPASPGGPSLRTRPDWVRVPTLDEIVDFFPRRALALGVEGRAVLDCRVAVTGRLVSCSIHEETPAGAGFGEAALQLAPMISMRPGTINGVPIADEPVRLPIAFRLPGGALPGLDGSLRCHGLLSAHGALSPGDSRLSDAARLAGERADMLMTDAGVDAGEREQRLASVRAAARRPERAGVTMDPCFMAFVQ